MRVLVTWASKRGGTRGIGETIARELETRGFDVLAAPVDRVDRVEDFDAALIGGALYANRWPAAVRRFVGRHAAKLRRMPVWMFSSGPLDESAEQRDIPPPKHIAVLAERIGARGHVTFGGRLERNAKGLLAGRMAKDHSGDWRNPARIQSWAGRIADELPDASPGRAVDHPGRSIARLVGFGFVGWALSAAILLVLFRFATAPATWLVYTVAVAFVFGALAWAYFRARGAREPLPTAITWTAIVAALDVLMARWMVEGDLPRLAETRGAGPAIGLVFLVTWMIGLVTWTFSFPPSSTPKTLTPSPAGASRGEG